MRISRLDRRFKIDHKALARLAREIIAQESDTNFSVNIVYCRDKEITRLNYRFKKKRTTTDVLAFNLADSDDPDFLGEIYINLQQARRQARQFQVSYPEEVKRLTAHGILHLLGYRDNTPANKKKMWARQEAYIDHGKTNRPPVSGAKTYES